MGACPERCIGITKKCIGGARKYTEIRKKTYSFGVKSNTFTLFLQAKAALHFSPNPPPKSNASRDAQEMQRNTYKMPGIYVKCCDLQE